MPFVTFKLPEPSYMICDQSQPVWLCLLPELRLFPVSPHYVCHDRISGKKKLHSSIKFRLHYFSLKSKTNYTFSFLYWLFSSNDFFFISIAYITANLNHFPLFVSLNSTFRASCLPPFHKMTVMSDEHTESSQNSMQFVTTRLSIRENVRFNQKVDCIEGFEDCGTERTRSIANHALLFMVRGLHRKWKQPVAYYFIRGSTKANLLVRFLNEVLGTCQNAGIQVVATVCDMAANSVKALKLLGATRRKPFFKFQDREIVTVYDPPHLLKCTRNLFLKYDVQFESERIHNWRFITA